MSTPFAEMAQDEDRLTVSVLRHSGVDVVSISGEIDAFSAHLVKQQVDASTQLKQSQVVADLSRVTFIDAGALGALVYCRRMLAARSVDLVLVCPGGPVLRLLVILGLDRLWTIHPSRDQALRALAC